TGSSAFTCWLVQWISSRNVRARRLPSLRLCSDALERSLRHDRGDRVLLDLHRDVVGELDRNVLIADLLDLAEQPAAGDHLVPAAERLDHRAMLLLPLRLRANQQEVEDHDEQDQR